ncbi:MAG: hypothetical protein IJD35_00020 [Clostridia bacterium]|nr:hypothetical protein [Clostridia bacterium]
MRLYLRGRKIRLSRKQEKLLARRATVLVLLLSLVTLTTVTIYNKAAPIAIENASAITRTKWESIVTEEVEEILKQGGYGYHSFATGTQDESGKITSLSVNSRLVTQISAAITKRLTQRFAATTKLKIPVPIGSVISPRYLQGVGFSVSVNTMAYTAVSVSIVSEVSSVGINQTRHRLSARIVTDTKLYCSNEKSEISHEYSILLAESIAFGNIPNSYFEYPNQA